MPINTFIFLDLEGTGLGGYGEKPRITELSMVAVHRLTMLDAASGYPHKPPRVMDKLTLCVYPMKPVSSGAAAISGLYNDNLLQKKDFDENLAQSLNLFIERQEAPVCLIAHNGLGYDYPLLKAELDALGLKLPEDVWCADSLRMLRELHAEDEAAEELKKQEELESSHETPAGSASRVQRSSSLGFESSGITEDRMRAVKRKLFEDEPTPQKKTAVEDKNDENDNVVADEKQKESSSQESSQSIEVINIASSEGTEVCSEPLKESVVVSQSSSVQIDSQASDASTVICSLRSNPTKQESNSESFERLPDSSDSTSESTSEETTPAKNVPSLIQKLSCTETISEDSGSDMELGRKVLRSTTWCSSLTDDMLLNYDLDSALKEYHEKDKENGTEKQTSGDVSSSTDQATPERDLSCAEGRLSDSPITSVQNPKPSTSSQNTAQTSIQEDRPMSKLEACRRHLQMQVENVRKNATSASTSTSSVSNNHHPSPSANQKRRVSYKLGDVYERLFGQSPSASHRAEDDSITLLLISQKTGARALKWCDDNCMLFDEVEPMYKAKGRTPLKPGTFPHH